MRTTRYRDRAGRTVELGAIDRREDLSAVVIEGRFGRRWVIDVYPNRLYCRRCAAWSCEHVEHVRTDLRDRGPRSP